MLFSASAKILQTILKMLVVEINIARGRYWFVPTNLSNISTRGVGTQCVLVGSDPSDSSKGGKGNMQGCVGALAPTWIPPPQCHNMFQPFPPGQRVQYSEMAANSSGHHHFPGEPAGRCGEDPCTRTVLPNHTEAGCCEACYLDFQGMTPCGYFLFSQYALPVCPTPCVCVFMCVSVRLPPPGTCTTAFRT